MKKFMEWLETEKIEEQKNGIHMTLKNKSIMDVLVEDYDAEKISDTELLMSKEEFETLKQVYENSLISWR